MSAALDLTALNLPDRRQEAWKYTDLSRLAASWPPLEMDGTPTEAAAPDARSLVNDDQPRLVFIDGHYSRELSTSSLTPEPVAISANWPQPGLQSLAEAAADRAGHWQIKVEQSPDQPLHLLFVASGQTDPLSRVEISLELAAGVRADLVEEHLGGRQGLALVSIDAQLAPSAELNWTRLQHLADGHKLLASQRTTLASQARCRQVNLDWGGQLARLDASLHLRGEAAELEYHALSGIRARQHVDHQVLVSHDAPRGHSLMRARGIIADSARQVFNGKVLVARGAQKTDSDQLLRNLLLSDKAEVDAKPELEIYADDVRCAHGSTVGRLDDTALFYLRSRGISVAEARRLLLLSFAAEILGQIADETLRQRAANAIADHLSLGQQA